MPQKLFHVEITHVQRVDEHPRYHIFVKAVSENEVRDFFAPYRRSFRGPNPWGGCSPCHGNHGIYIKEVEAVSLEELKAPKLVSVK